MTMWRRDDATGCRASSGGSYVNLAEADQREMAERRHQAAFHQFDAERRCLPFGVARPAEFGGTETERAHHRLQALLDDAAHAGIGADPGQDDQFAARL